MRHYAAAPPTTRAHIHARSHSYAHTMDCEKSHFKTGTLTLDAPGGRTLQSLRFISKDTFQDPAPHAFAASRLLSPATPLNTASGSSTCFRPVGGAFSTPDPPKRHHRPGPGMRGTTWPAYGWGRVPGRVVHTVRRAAIPRINHFLLIIVIKTHVFHPLKYIVRLIYSFARLRLSFNLPQSPTPGMRALLASHRAASAMGSTGVR